MKQIDQKYFDNPEQYIPHGIYCYNGNGQCPFWDKDESKPEQQNGYCHYLKMGDWEFDCLESLIWDQVKECQIKEERVWMEEIQNTFK